MSEETKITIDQTSADPSLSRKEFIQKAVKGATLAAGAVVAPQIIDKFLVPKAYAQTSTDARACTNGLATNAQGQTDSVITTNPGATKDVECTSGSGAGTIETLCAGGGDVSLVCPA